MAKPAMSAAVRATSGAAARQGPHQSAREVYEDRNAGGLNDLVEEGGVGGDGLGEGREWGFAGSAATGLGEVGGGYAVLLTALFAGSDDGHAWPPVVGCDFRGKVAGSKPDRGFARMTEIRNGHGKNEMRGFLRLRHSR